MDSLQEYNKIVGINIRNCRLNAGLNQQQLGDVLGVTFQQMQKYERGLNRVSAASLKMLSEYMNTPIEYFFGEQEKAFPNMGNAKASKRPLQILNALMLIEDRAVMVLIERLILQLASQESVAN